MKKTRKLKVLLFSAVILVSMFLGSTPVFARIRHRIKFRSSKSISYNLTPEQKKWLIISFIFFFILVIIVLSVIVEYKKKKNLKDSTSSESYHEDKNSPKDISEEISSQIQNNDSCFNAAQFLIYAGNTAKKIVMASCKGDMDVLKALETEELFNKHSTLIQQKVHLTSRYDIEDFSADIIKLTEYTADNTSETISVYMNCTIFRNSYDTKITNPCNLLLTFKRPINTVSSDFGNGICPSCNAEVPPENSRCTLCGYILNFNTNGWELVGFKEIPGLYYVF